MKVDNKKIGELAVQAVDAAFARVDNVLTHFNKDDTGICIDGHIEVYSDADMNKETLCGELPVQIKGTMAKPSNPERPKRSVKVLDLKQFLDIYNGAIYFQVFFNGDLSVRGIYYKEYLPYDLIAKLRSLGNEGQGEVSERFARLPDDPKQLKRICQDFNINQKRQRGMNAVGFGSVEEWKERGLEFERFELVKTLFSNELPFHLDSMRNGAYIYGISAFGQAYAVDKLEDVCAVETSGIYNVRSGSFNEQMRVILGEDEDGDFMRFGSFTIRMGGPATMNYADKGDFRDRYRDARLAKELGLTGCLAIGDVPICNDASFDEMSGDDIDERIDLYGRYASLLEKLSIKPRWDPEQLEDSELEHIGALGASLVDGHHIPLNGICDSLANLNVDIQGARIKIIGKRDDDGRYEFYDPMTPSMFFVIGYQKDEAPDEINPVPTMMLFNQEDFKLAANIDPAKFRECLDKFPILPATTEAICDKLLQMLHAYDSAAICANELIECCLMLADGLVELEPNNRRYRINRAQVLARMGQLGEGERRLLLEYATNSADGQIQASAHILLGNRELAEASIRSLEEGDRAAFLTWPIYNLLAKTV